MKQKLFLLMLVAMLTSPVFVTADFGYPAIMQVSTHNFIMHGLDYNGTAKIVRLEAAPYDDSWYNIGLGALEIKFNNTYPPQLQYLEITWMNETIENPIDMLKNYTLTDGTYNMGNETHPDPVSCRYLLIYFYFYPDHVIINEQPMPNFIGAEWNYTDNITAPPQPAVLAQDFVPASTGNVKLIIPVEGYIPQEEPTTTTTYDPSKFAVMIGALCVFVIAAVIVVFVLVKHKFRSTY